MHNEGYFSASQQAEVLVARQKQLELLLQHKVAARIAQVEEAWRVSEASEEVTLSGIVGYGKGKVPEKHICMNCLRKGVECKWDKGGQGTVGNKTIQMFGGSGLCIEYIFWLNG